MTSAEQIKSTQWLEHLRGLAKLESNIGKKVAFDTCADMLEQQQAQIERLEQQYEQLVAYGKLEHELPLGAFHGTRELVNQIKNDALDMGGCYEVSTGLLDQLFEAYKDKNALQLLVQRDLVNKIEALESLLLEVQWSGEMGEEVVTGNEIESRIYQLKDRLKNGGEL